MSEMELVELFGVIAPTLRAAIRAILEWEELSPAMRLVTFLIIIDYMNEYKCSQNMRLLQLSNFGGSTLPLMIITPRVINFFAIGYIYTSLHCRFYFTPCQVV